MYPSVTGSKYERQTQDIRHQLGKFIWLTLYMLKETLGHLQTSLDNLSNPKTTNDSYAFQYTPDTIDRLQTPTTSSIERQSIYGYYSYLQSSQSLSLVVYSLYCLSWRGCSKVVYSSLQQSIVVYSSLLTLGASCLQGKSEGCSSTKVITSLYSLACGSYPSYILCLSLLKGDTSIQWIINCHICIDEGHSI